MENMKTPVGFEQSVQRRSRFARLLVASAALIVGSSAWAQTYGVSTYAGLALQAASSDTATGPATAARFNTPKGVAVDTAGNVYVADAVNGSVRKIAAVTGITTTIGTGFISPAGVAVDGSGVVYVADTGHHRIAKIVGAVITVIAGDAAAGTFGLVDSATMTTARFWNPTGIAVNAAGSVAYVADTTNNVIRKIDITGATGVTTIAGTVTLGSGVAGLVNASPGTAASFTSPYAVALNAAGTLLFVADRGNHSIRQVALTSSNAVTTFAGTSGTFGSADSPTPLFKNPEGIAIDAGGVLYVTDSGNATVRMITSAGLVSTIAGTAGLSGTGDGLSTVARFQEPFGVAVHSSGNIFVADAASQTIRRLAAALAPGVTLPLSAPLGNTVTAGGTISYATTITGSPAATIQWQVQPAAGGGFTPVTLVSPYSVATTAFTSTLTITGATTALSGNQYRVVAVNGVAPDATSAAVTLTVNQPPAMANVTTTKNFTLLVSSAFTFTATGSPAPTLSILSGNYPDTAVLTQNAVGSTTTGTITWAASSSQASGSPYTFTVKATNGFGTDATQAFTFTVLTGPTITTAPVAQSVNLSQPAMFSVAATTNGGTLTYQWQKQAAGTLGGYFSIPEGGVYSGTTTAMLTIASVNQPMSGDQFQVVVSSGVGTPATSIPVALTVTQPPQITSLNIATFVESQLGTYTVQAQGSPVPTYALTSGTLPNGLSFDTTSGVISGAPTVGTSATSPYFLQFTASNGAAPVATQSFTLTVTPAALAPVFTTQPVNATAVLGQVATFTAAASGNPAPTFQWQRFGAGAAVFTDIANDTTFSGANTTMLTITNPVSGMNGDSFRLNATNSSGVTSSSTVTLTLVIGTTITTIAGQATVAGSNDGVGTAAHLNGPAAVGVDAFGNLYVADSLNHVIRKITSTGVVTTLAGTAGLNGSVDGTGAAARFNTPSGIAVTSLGTVYVADTYNHTVRVVTPEGVVTTLAGLAGNTGSVDGTGNTARFFYPYGVTIDSIGTVHVADTFNHTIRRIQAGGVVTTLAGLAGARGTTNSTGAAARFAYPFAIALDNVGTLYVADSFNHAIRKIDTVGNVSTLAGNAGAPGTTDGTGVAALFNQPSGLTVDSSGNVYVADTYSNTIRRVTSVGVVTTMAGFAGSAGSADGVGSAARFTQPFGIVVDAAGVIFIADTRNHTIRRSGSVAAPSIATQPQSAVAVVGGTASFSVAVLGSPTPTIFTWLRQPAGTIGYAAVVADGTYSGVNSPTLTVSGVTSAMSGDQFSVIVSNLISPNAQSSAVQLFVGTVPVFTSAASATFQATNAGTFTIAASATPAPTFSAANLPPWATLDANTGVLSGTAPDTTGAPFTIVVTASNGLSATQSFTLAVLPAVIAPTIATAPASAAVDQGSTAVFSVTVAGTAPLSYLWSRNGVPISGASAATLSLTNVQPSTAGVYTVTVTNPAGAVTSSASLVVNTAPSLALQPRSQTALVGTIVTFAVNATGSTSFNYQWRKNGVAIGGANGASLTLTGVSAVDAGNYDVVVRNALGEVSSSLAQLSVVSAPVAPVITAQPANRTVLAGGSITLSVGASGAPTPSYQWRKNGVAIAGANNFTLTVTGAQGGDAGSYDVIIANSAGTVVSSGGTLRVLVRSYVGTYFGSFAGNLGTFAMRIRDDNTGVFLGYLPGSTVPVMSLNLLVNDSGGFSFSQSAIASSAGVSPNEGEPARAAALGSVVVAATIATDGSVSGSMFGGANASLSAVRSIETGATQGVAGFYQAGASGSAAVSYTIASPNGQAFVVVQSGSTTDGGTGTVTAGGAVSVVTGRSVLSAAISSATGTVTGSASGAVFANLVGASEAALARQRLVNISSRARVGTGDSQAIAGFVISGEDSKPVLIRAVGPTLGAAPFNVAGVLASPRLELFRGSTSLLVNTGIAAARVAIDAAGQQAGAFALGSSGADAAILTTLAPGAYTAVVSSTTGTAGVALVEVYDLSAAAPGQKLMNIATRASAGTADATLIAGFVVPAGATKRVLVRGVGPGLSVFGVSGVLAQPTLQLLSGSSTVAQNTNWSTSADRDAITASSAQVGAFGLASGDSALIATLAPGNYTATITGAGGATGVALIEVYELP